MLLSKILIILLSLIFSNDFDQEKEKHLSKSMEINFISMASQLIKIEFGTAKRLKVY
jgi:hypothetical protein